MKKVFSGIQPSGEFHLGNYLGAMKNWVSLQEDHECIFSIVDLHAITVNYDQNDLPNKILNAAKDAIAVGIDPKKSVLFLQSDIKEHTELAWLLNTITNIGELSRMTQYKEKSDKYDQRVGLFDYPVLMAADILLYNAEIVPVGEDQIQHLELTRELARRFNARFGEIFIEPEAKLTPMKRILGLDGNGKMSKSNAKSSYIAINDSKDTISEKIMSAATDSGRDEEISPATENLFNLMEAFSSKERALYYRRLRKEGTIRYSEFKPELISAIIAELSPIQERRARLSDDYVKSVLKESAQKLQPIASQNILKIKEKMGLYLL